MHPRFEVFGKMEDDRYSYSIAPTRLEEAATFAQAQKCYSEAPFFVLPSSFGNSSE